MFKDKIKNWVRDVFNLSVEVSDDVNIDIVRANYQKYQDELKQRQKAYIKSLCNRINRYSRMGQKCTTTYCDLSDELNTPEFRAEIKEYFKQRGFSVQEKSVDYGVIETYLIINWDV